MRAIFISYRRDDSEGQTGRLFDDLESAFGRDAVFMDVTAVEPGRDFRRAIDEHVASCGVLLCVIGRHWLTLNDDAGRRRLDDPGDFVRLETASALRRDIPVVPVLVHGATMPSVDDLPADLRELAFRNAFTLTHTHWDSDVEMLIAALRRQLPAATTVDTDSPPGTSSPWWKRGLRPQAASWRRWLVAASVTLLLAGAVGLSAWGRTLLPHSRVSLAGTWDAAACINGLLVLADDGKQIEGVCDTGLLHRFTGTYVDARSLDIVVTRIDRDGCQSQAKGRWTIDNDDQLETFQEGWNDEVCRVKSQSAHAVMRRLKTIQR